MATSFTKIQVRRGTKARWTQFNTVLEAGELGFEEDTYRFKIGQINPVTGKLYDWNTLPYFAEQLDADEINLNGSINISDDGCFKGNVVPCADDTYTIGDVAKRWKELKLSQSLTLGNIEITEGPASPATGDQQNFLKINGDDIATRTELEKVTSSNLNLANPTDPIPPYIYSLFDVLERSLPPRENISTQSQFNGWVVAALEYLDNTIVSDGDKITIGENGEDVIIGPGPGSDACSQKLDIYNETTVHCMLEAKRGIKVLDAPGTNFVKSDGTVSEDIPLEQSIWLGVPRLS